MENIRNAGLEGELNQLLNEADSIEDISGGTVSAILTAPTADGIVSYFLGNKGYVCTWTVECMEQCK